MLVLKLNSHSAECYRGYGGITIQNVRRNGVKLHIFIMVSNFGH